MKEVGSVLVDSGMVALISSANHRLWTERDTGPVLGVAIWGGSLEDVKSICETKGIAFEKLSGKIYIPIQDSIQGIVDHTALVAVLQDRGCKFAYHLIRNNSYDRLLVRKGPIHDIVLDDQVHHSYVVNTIHGDGSYTVWQINDGYEISFLEYADRNRKSIVELLAIVELDQDEEWKMEDPCRLDEPFGEGCTFQLPAGRYRIEREQTRDKYRYTMRLRIVRD